MRKPNCCILAFILSVFSLAPDLLIAQVGVGTTNPATSAELEIKSTTRGLLLPRLTEVQRNAIQNPVAGLVIWCSNCSFNGEMQVYDGISWTNAAGGLASPPAVKIGNQIWMLGNLNNSTYQDGTPLLHISDPTIWANTTQGAYHYYNNDSATYAAIYGKMYNWYAVADSRNVCPKGWHIPSDAEWTTLENYLGGSLVAGGKLKDTGTLLWTAPNTDATNSSGFTALPGGGGGPNGDFNDIHNTGVWWTATEANINQAYFRWISYFGGVIFRNFDGKKFALSVRCIKD